MIKPLEYFTGYLGPLEKTTDNRPHDVFLANIAMHRMPSLTQLR